ncbi:MAG TPA: hypothetical protein PK765_03095 [bacterium]|nr:hypothetical protein [bacterium]
MGNAHIITEHKDDTLENYFFGLIMAKAVTYETIDGVLAKIRYLPTELGDRTSEMRWLSEEERMAII